MAAVIGGAVVLGGGYGLYQAGIVKLPAEANQQLTSALSSAERKIADLESKLGEVSSTISSQNVGDGLSALETKVSSLESKIETAASSAATDLTPAFDALKSDVENLRSEIENSVGGTGDGTPINLKPLETRLAALEDAAKGQSAGAQVDLQPLETRLSKLESEATANTSEAGKLSGSVTGLETQLGELKTSLAEVQNRLQNAEATAKAAQTAVSTSDVSLKTLADSQARATETLSSLSADIKAVGDANSAALEDIRAELTAISKRLSQVESTMGDATARETAARALSVSALKSAVDSGRPYATELAAVKAGLPSDIDLQALEANAKTGVEPVSVLIAQFPSVARSMFQTFSEPDHSGDVLDSLLASAKSIVSVRGPGDADGSGPEAALRQMENAVSNGNLKGALAAYDKLPEAAQTAGADWAGRAKARVAVDALTDKASQEVLNALAAKDS
ncbi:COG4223 family protein [Roseibium sp. SCP14]|uniref:COG4223 family protein n=1 Tax=Roseibium sp. SCP14 TaxID=3141375 RepID=UPI00333BD5C7